MCVIRCIDNKLVYVYSTYEMNVYSVEEAAKTLKFDPGHIRRLLAKGEIEGKKLGRDWVVFSLDYKRKRKPKRRRTNEKS